MRLCDWGSDVPSMSLLQCAVVVERARIFGQNKVLVFLFLLPDTCLAIFREQCRGLSIPTAPVGFHRFFPPHALALSATGEEDDFTADRFHERQPAVW